MLLRLESSKNMRRFLYLNIAVQLVLGTYNTLAQTLQCFPLEKAWDLLGRIPGTCWGRKSISISSIVVSSVNIVTDIIFALLPYNFLRNLQRPLRERIIIACLMGLGLFTAVASTIKMVAAINFGKSQDLNKESIELGTWSCVEGLIGLIAACIPCLRSPFQRALEFLGLVTTHNRTTYGHGYADMYGQSKKKTTHKSKPSADVDVSRTSTASGFPIKMHDMRHTDAASEDNILPSEDGKNGEIWCTTEVHLNSEGRSRDLEAGRR
jgi:hypothetical protein